MNMPIILDMVYISSHLLCQCRRLMDKIEHNNRLDTYSANELDSVRAICKAAYRAQQYHADTVFA